MRRMLQRSQWLWLLTGVMLGVLAMQGVDFARERTRTADARALAVFEEAYTLTRDRYVVESEAQPRELIYDAIRGMVEGLGDTAHSRFLTPEQRTRESQSLSGQIVGIGVQMTERDGRPVVVAAFPNSPAARAGMRANDRILRVNGDDVSSLPLTELGQRLQGPAGADVRLIVLHGDDTVIDVTIKREEVRVPSVTWAPLADSTVWHIHIRQFSDGTAAQLDQALTAARGVGATGIVLDLRENPGGYLNEAVKVASRFLDEGVVLFERSRDGATEPRRVEGDAPTTDLPIIVLINNGSASSSEVVTAALQYYHRATAIGTPTFGTATVLRSFPLSDGSALVLGVDEWLTPGNEPLRNKGVTPDERVELPADVHPLIPAQPAASAEQPCGAQDRQLARAAAALGVQCSLG